jgi:hypothetical protein
MEVYIFGLSKKGAAQFVESIRQPSQPPTSLRSIKPHLPFVRQIRRTSKVTYVEFIVPRTKIHSAGFASRGSVRPSTA